MSGSILASFSLAFDAFLLLIHGMKYWLYLWHMKQHQWQSTKICITFVSNNNYFTWMKQMKLSISIHRALKKWEWFIYFYWFETPFLVVWRLKNCRHWGSIHVNNLVEPTAGWSMIKNRWPACSNVLQGWHLLHSCEAPRQYGFTTWRKCPRRGKAEEILFLLSPTLDWAGSSTRLG